MAKGATGSNKKQGGSGSEPQKKGGDPTWNKIGEFAEWMTYNMGPGPHVLPMRYYANIQKGGTVILMLILMLYYRNYSEGAWLYLMLHGSYGIFWLMKDFTFPDAQF